MTTFLCPEEWYDHNWLANRSDLLHSISNTSDTLEIDFRQCQWLDLHPLVDLTLQIGLLAQQSRSVTLLFNQPLSKGEQRVLRFLLEAGFIRSLAKINNQYSGDISCALGESENSPENFERHVSRMPLPAPILNCQTILPCSFFDIRTLASDRPVDRSDIFHFCLNLRRQCLAQGRAPAIRLPFPLLEEARLFFSSILPEVVDNIRIHKSPSSPATFSAFMRLRRREQRLSSRQRIAEPKPPNLSPLKQRTSRYWRTDILEFVLSDSGMSIQESWIKGWNFRIKDRRHIPRLPDTTRVDGPNGDEIILRGVFEQNASSLPESDRTLHGLPIRLSGLRAVREVIQNSDYVFSVKSGQNYVIVAPDAKGDRDGSTNRSNVKPHGRFPSTDGVHYYFRFTSRQGRPLENWYDVSPTKSFESTDSWWLYDYPNRFDRAHVCTQYDIPKLARTGDVLIARPQHMPAKDLLYSFLAKAKKRGLHILFFEIPPPIAIGLYQMLKYIVPADIDIACPIVTNSFHARIPGQSYARAIGTFVSDFSDDHRLWWNAKNSPIRNLAEAVRKCRQHDSNIFWTLVQDSTGAVLSEPVGWTDGIILRGGYVSFPVALGNPRVRKLVRKRLVVLAQAMRASQVVPSTERLRYLAKEIENSVVLDQKGENKTAVIGSVMVTGETFRRAGIFGDSLGRSVFLPVLVYPEEGLERAEENETSPIKPGPRAFDWNQLTILDGPVRYSRLGNSEQIRRKPDRALRISGKQSADRRYDVWQRHNLLEIGHFSYGQKHYYIWLDLKRFLNDKSADSQEMLDSMLDQIEKWSPDWIFYIPHEVSDALIARLIERDRSTGKNLLIESRIWPTTALENFAAAFVPAAPTLFGEEKSQLSKALVVDDAVVTGDHQRNASVALQKLGFETVHSLVILDRGDPEVCLPSPKFTGGGHFSWWSLLVPAIGSAGSCRMCQVISEIETLSHRSGSTEVSRVVARWVSEWSHSDHLLRFNSRVQEEPLSEILQKRFGDPSRKNLDLRSNVAACVWSLDVSQRLFDYEYLFRKGTNFPKEALAEALAGILLLHWVHLEHSARQRLVTELLNRLWEDPRSPIRSLVAVALLSLAKHELHGVCRLYGLQVRSRGLKNIDSVIFGYFLTEITTQTPAEARELIESWRRERGDSQLTVDEQKRTDALLNVLLATGLRRSEDTLALQIVGIAGRGLEHQHVYEVLDDLVKRPAGLLENDEVLFLLRAYLEPVRGAIRRHEALFSRYGVKEYLDEVFTDFDGALGSLADSSSDAEVEKFSALCGRLKRFLALDFYESRPCVRKILSRELIHYLPYETRSTIRDLIAHKKGPEVDIDYDDYRIQDKETTEEGQLLRSTDVSEAERFRLHEILQRRDVVCVRRSELVTVLRDCLVDVIHPKGRKLGLDGSESPPFMEISFAVKPQSIEGNPGYWVTFENLGDEEHFLRSKEARSWELTKTILRAIGGVAKTVLRNGRIVRRIGFPVFRGRR